MKPLGNGKLLNATLSVRLALIDTFPRQRMIEEIAKHLRAAEKAKNGIFSCPQDWYRPRKGQ